LRSHDGLRETMPLRPVRAVLRRPFAGVGHRDTVAPMPPAAASKGAPRTFLRVRCAICI